MENLTSRFILASNAPLMNRLRILKHNFYYTFEDVKDYKENASKMEKNPIVSLFSTGYASQESNYRNGAIVVMSPLWGNATRVDENFLKLNVRDYSGELELDVFDSTKFNNDRIAVAKEFLDAIESPVVDWGYWSKKLREHDVPIFGKRKPIKYARDVVEFEKEFEGINSLIGSMYAFHSFDDGNLYLIDTSVCRMPKRKKEVSNWVSLFDLSLKPALI